MQDDLTPPMWVQSYAKPTAGECESGWSPSWAQWPNDGRGGPVCNRYILWRSGTLVVAPDPDQGPFTAWQAT